MAKKTFEESMNRLEEIVKILEDGKSPLEESLGYFEEGTAIIKECSGLLDKAEQKVVKLQKGPEGEPVESLFDTEE